MIISTPTQMVAVKDEHIVEIRTYKDGAYHKVLIYRHEDIEPAMITMTDEYYPEAREKIIAWSESNLVK